MVWCVTTRQSLSGAAKPRIWHTSHGSCDVFILTVPAGLFCPHAWAVSPWEVVGMAGVAPRAKPPEILAHPSFPNPFARIAAGGAARPLLPSCSGWRGLVIAVPAHNAGKDVGPHGLGDPWQSSMIRAGWDHPWIPCSPRSAVLLYAPQHVPAGWLQ